MSWPRIAGFLGLACLAGITWLSRCEASPFAVGSLAQQLAQDRTEFCRARRETNPDPEPSFCRARRSPDPVPAPIANPGDPFGFQFPFLRRWPIIPFPWFWHNEEFRRDNDDDDDILSGGGSCRAPPRQNQHGGSCQAPPTARDKGWGTNFDLPGGFGGTGNAFPGASDGGFCSAGGPGNAFPGSLGNAVPGGLGNAVQGGPGNVVPGGLGNAVPGGLANSVPSVGNAVPEGLGNSVPSLGNAVPEGLGNSVPSLGNAVPEGLGNSVPSLGNAVPGGAQLGSLSEHVGSLPGAGGLPDVGAAAAAVAPGGAGAAGPAGAAAAVAPGGAGAAGPAGAAAAAVPAAGAAGTIPSDLAAALAANPGAGAVLNRGTRSVGGLCGGCGAKKESCGCGGGGGGLGGLGAGALGGLGAAGLGNLGGGAVPLDGLTAMAGAAMSNPSEFLTQSAGMAKAMVPGSQGLEAVMKNPAALTGAGLTLGEGKKAVGVEAEKGKLPTVKLPEAGAVLGTLSDGTLTDTVKHGSACVPVGTKFKMEE